MAVTTGFEPTQKQLQYAESLAEELDLGYHKAWDLIAWHFNMSRSMAYRKMTKFRLSKAIDAAKTECASRRK
jgi:hypothetical protein